MVDYIPERGHFIRLSFALKAGHEQMDTDYIDQNVKLGWLIDRKHKKVYIYRPQVLVECLENPVTVSSDPILPGFVLDLSKIW